MEPVRSVLYLDFDNVFSGLMKLDPRHAMRFAEDPSVWLGRLASDPVQPRERRWLVLRCYMNPSGWLPHPDDVQSRLYFSRFRPYFTDAGFEVIDCPRLSHTKNGADIRLVIDAVEALRADVRFEEFVIASGDSDMTPLIVRLRAADRRITVLSPSDSAVVLGAVADRMIGGEELLELLQVPTSEDAEPDEHVSATDTSDSANAAVSDPHLSEGEAITLFGSLVSEHYARATEPINLARLSVDVRRQLGSVAISSGWFGYTTFTQALQSLDLPHVRIWQQFMWDSTRHASPEADADRVEPEDASAVARVARVLKLPRLQPASWQGIYEALAAFVGAYEFNLNEATRWARDRVQSSGIPVNRPAVGLVARGAAFGGCPLYRQPPPGPEEIAAAFVSNVVDRAAASDIDLSQDEVREVHDWLGYAPTPIDGR